MCIYFFHNIHASPPRDVPFQNVLEPRNVRRHIKATWQTIPDGGPKTSNTMILSLKMYLPLTNSVPRSHLLVLIPVNQGIFHKGSEGESTQISPLTKKAKQSRNSIKREDRRRGLGGLQGPMSGKTQPVLEVGGNGECGWRALALTIAAQNANSKRHSHRQFVDKMDTLSKTMGAQVTSYVINSSANTAHAGPNICLEAKVPRCLHTKTADETWSLAWHQGRWSPSSWATFIARDSKKATS